MKVSDGDSPGIESLAHQVSTRLAITIAPHELQTLLDARIPSALFECSTQTPRGDSPLMLQRRLIDGATLTPLLRLARPLFEVRTAAVLMTLCVLVYVLVGVRFLTQPQTLSTASEILGTFTLTLVGILLHELGHLAACHRFNGRHDGIGLGLYWCLPAFYAEVHGAWTLPRRQRAAVDVAGVYFQFLFVALLGALWLIAPFPGFVGTLAWTQLLMLHTLNPVLKFDGYWLLSDLAGIHNLHTRVREIGRSLLCLKFASLQPAALALFVSFLGVAVAYFMYSSAVLGHGIASAAQQLLASWQAQGISAVAIGHALVLALLVAVAAGSSILLARAVASMFVEGSR